MEIVGKTVQTFYQVSCEDVEYFISREHGEACDTYKVMNEGGETLGTFAAKGRLGFSFVGSSLMTQELLAELAAEFLAKTRRTRSDDETTDANQTEFEL